MRDSSETIDLFNKAFLLDFRKQTWVSLKLQAIKVLPNMLMKKKCDAEVNYRTMGGQRFGLTGRAQDHLILCTGLEQPNVLFLYSFLDH